MASDDCLSLLLSSLQSAHEIELVPTEVYAELVLPHSGFSLREGTLLISHAGIAVIYKAAKAVEPQYQGLVALAVVSGEMNTVWNAMRKSFSAERMECDLAVNSLVLKLHKKASCAWRYREFLLSQPHSFSYPREAQLLSSIIASKSHHYFAWQHRLFLLRNLLTTTEIQTDFEAVLRHCESHLTDASAFHYLRIVARNAGKEIEAWEWVKQLCEVYYAPLGLYDGQEAYGLETVSLFLSSIHPAGDPFPLTFYQTQIDLGRHPPLWLLGKHSTN